MNVKTFSDLFEDEVAEELRSAGHCAVISCGIFTYEPALMLAEDGAYSSTCGLYMEYICGRPSGVVGPARLVNVLAHKEFTITEEV